MRVRPMEWTGCSGASPVGRWPVLAWGSLDVRRGKRSALDCTSLILFYAAIAFS